MTLILAGSLPALITPFRDGLVDEAAFAALVERQIAAGVSGLVPNGTTGEAVTLSVEEQKRIIKLCVEVAAGRVPVIAGAGSNDTAKTIELATYARNAGATASLVVTPYYNRPSQEGLIAHFTAVADGSGLPVVVYNVPIRTGVDLQPESVAALARHPGIIGVKDASGQLERTTRQRALCGREFSLLSGDDGTAVGFNAMGGNGCISVTANVAPELCVRLQACCAAGDFGSAHDIDLRLYTLHRALFAEPSPAPTKYAVARLGLCREDVRLPMIPLSAATRELVDAALARAGLL